MSRAYIYEDIVGRITCMIEDGALQPGEKAPSLRRLSGQLGVSMTSVMKAYTILEGRGLLEATPQSGFYVRDRPCRRTPRPEMTQPEVVRTEVTKSALISSFLKTVHGPDNHLFACATADMSLLPIDELGKIISAVGRDARLEALDYCFPPGNITLRREIGKRSLQWGCSLGTDEMVITSGGLEALNLSLRAVTRPGDAVAIESPTYFGVLQAIENLGLQAVEVPTCSVGGADLDVLEALMKQKTIKACLLITNFNNPLGSLMSDEDKRHMAELANRYEVPLIEDDVYGDIFFGERRPKPVKAFDRNGWVLLCSSFSKTLSPGLRVGFLANERYTEAIKSLQFMSTLAAPSCSQEVVARFIASGKYDRHLRKFRRALQGEVSRYRSFIAESFPAGTKVSQPQGGFVIWVGLPPGVDAVALGRLASSEGFHIAPGALFTARKDFHNFMRLNCANPWSPRVERGLQILADLTRQLTPKVS